MAPLRSRHVQSTSLLLALGAGACVDSGQTGSPFDSPPDYQISEDFTPRGEDSGVTPSDGQDQGTRPDYANRDESVAGFSDGTLVVAEAQALRLFDVSGERPKQVAFLPLRGQLLQIEVEDGFAWVVLRETPFIDSEEVPAEAQPLAKERLIAFDLSDPEEVRRIASIDLEGDRSEEGFWRFERRGRSFFVLQEIISTKASTCGTSRTGSGGATQSMRVSHVDFDAEAFRLVDSQELPTNQAFAYYSDSSYFALDADPDRFESGSSGLSWIDFSGGNLVAHPPVTIGRRPSAVVKGGDSVFVLVDNVLQALSLEGAAVTSRGQLDLGTSSTQLRIVNEKTLLVLGGGNYGGAQVVDTSDLDKLRVVGEFPPETLELIETESGLVSLQTNEQGELSVLLWDVSAAGAPLEVSRWDSTLSYSPALADGYTSFDSAALHSWSFDQNRGLLLIPVSHTSEGKQSSALVTLKVEAASISWFSQQLLQKRSFRPLNNGESLFDVRYGEIEMAPLVEGAAPDDSASTLQAYVSKEPLDSLKLGSDWIHLWEREADGRFYLELEHDDGSTETLELDHRAHDLVEAGGRVTALGLRASDEECEQFSEEDLESMEGQEFNSCAEFRRAGISVVEVGRSLSLVEYFPITSTMDSLDGEDTWSSWVGYFSLLDGRIAFAINYSLRCHSKESCEELGVPSYRSESAGGCPGSMEGEAVECDASTQVNWSGTRNSLRLYLLDGMEGAEPSLELGVEVQGAGRLDVFEGSANISDRVFVAEEGVGVATQEWIYNEMGESKTDDSGHGLVRFYFNRVSIEEDGSLVAEPRVNTPGVAVAWQGDALLTVEPRYLAETVTSARWHRSKLVGSGAFIEDSRDLQGSFVGALRYGHVSYILTGPEDACDEEPKSRLTPLILAESSIEWGTALELKHRWYFPYGVSAFQGEGLRLLGGPVDRATLALDLEDPMAPSIRRYATDWSDED